jgi:uncharacterized membrane protein YphA (DoxX/SURF4 family)
MRIVVWVVQVLLAAMFLWHGALFLFPPPELLEIMNAEFGSSFRTFLGVMEILAGIGIILPALTRILPWLTTWAAIGIMIVVGSASILHATRGETSSAITTFILFLLASFVAYMRWKVIPIAPRTSNPITA